MFNTLQLKNFKAFKDTGELEIKPITILIGPNSSGKSSLLQPFLLFKQTVDSRDITSPLVVNGSYVKLSNYESFINKHDLNNPLEVSFSFEAKDPFQFKDTLQGNCDIKVSFIFNKSRKRIELNFFEAKFLNESFKIERIKLKTTSRYQATLNYYPDRPTAKSDDSTDGQIKTLVLPKVSPVKFYNFLPSSFKKISVPFAARKIVFSVQSILEGFINDIYYIGPLRESPKNLYVSGGELRKDVGLKGEFATDVLWAQSQGTKRKSRHLLNQVNKWMNIFDLGSEVRLEPLGKHQGFFQLLITNPSTKVDASISDVGFGVSQVLPLIVEGFYSSPRSTLFVEQPEIHLHPKVQAELGDLLIALVSSGKKIVVETHSEHLISRLTRRIAEGDVLTKDDVAIYYFSTDSEKTNVKRIHINELGQFEDWPDGFFQEDYKEAVIHSKIIAQKIANQSKG